MKTTKMDNVVNKKAGELIDDRDAPPEKATGSGEMQLMILAIDPSNLMENRSVTFQFAERDEGMMAFHTLAATAENLHRACVGDLVRLHLVRKSHAESDKWSE